MKKALCVLLSVVMLLSMSVTAFAADTKGAPSQTLPSWLPVDAPAPDAKLRDFYCSLLHQ